MERRQSGEDPFLPYLPEDCEPRTKALQASKRRSWVAKQVFRRKREVGSTQYNLASKFSVKAARQNRIELGDYGSALWPTTSLSLQLCYEEGRSLQFFCERTSKEWSGWSDHEFWSSLVPQAAASCPALKHAMISLGAYHESLEAHAKSASAVFQALSVRQGNKAIACLRENYDMMSWSAILCCHLVMTEFSGILGHFTYFQNQKIQYEVLDELRRQKVQNRLHIPDSEWHYISTYLEPLVEMHRNRLGRLIDPLYMLRITPLTNFHVPKLLPIPQSFDSLWQARESLESLLYRTACAVKTGCFPVTQLPRESEERFEQWLASLQNFRDTHPDSGTDFCTWKMLRSTSKISFVMIRTMYAEDEMIFDQYEDEYRELASAASQYLACNRHGSSRNVCFGIDSGFLDFIGWVAQRWCRDPTTRRQLVDILFAAQRREGSEGSELWARICQGIQTQEEIGISPTPLSCYDIPREKRLRIHEGRFYSIANLLCITMLRPPYYGVRRTDFQHFWIPLSAEREETPKDQELICRLEKETDPDMVIAKGYMSFMLLGKQTMVEASRFYFSIPRLQQLF